MFNGFLNIYKPKDLTSHDVVYKVRKKLKTKTGHLGTLDPMAEGVLPVALENATRLIQFLPAQIKTYLAEITLGIHTDTLDMQGKIIEKKAPRIIDEVFLKDTLKSFSGHSKQTPPKYSAVKVSGRKAYDLARKDIDFKLTPRDIEIFSIELLSYNHPEIKFRVKASPGTYVRTLCEDIGRKLGELTALSSLVREQSGSFFINNSVSLDSFNNMNEEEIKNIIIPVRDVFSLYPSLKVKKGLESKIFNGVSLIIDDFEKDNKLELKDKEKLFIYTGTGALIALGELVIDKNIEVKPVKVFKE
ncbi:MAG: tRNA pseudouridine(55) synthase TruB [Armatimonadota bacterium]